MCLTIGLPLIYILCIFNKPSEVVFLTKLPIYSLCITFFGTIGGRIQDSNVLMDTFAPGHKVFNSIRRANVWLMQSYLTSYFVIRVLQIAFTDFNNLNSATRTAMIG